MSENVVEVKNLIKTYEKGKDLFGGRYFERLFV